MDKDLTEKNYAITGFYQYKTNNYQQNSMTNLYVLSLSVFVKNYSVMYLLDK